MNLYASIEAIGRQQIHEKMVLVDNEAFTNEALTFESFFAQTNKLSNALVAAGIGPGDKIALVLPNSTLWVTLYWATVKIGALPVPLDPQIGEWELSQLLAITDTKICFGITKYKSNPIWSHLESLATRLPELLLVQCDATGENGQGMSLAAFTSSHSANTDVATCAPSARDALMMACTSGSTGNPKIITVPHLGFYLSQRDMGAYLGFSSKDVMLLGMPLYHQGGLGMGLQMTLAGGTVMYQSTFDPETCLDIIEKEKVTVIQLTATLAKILLSAPGFKTERLSSVRMAYFAGEVLPMEIAKEFFEKRDIRVVNVIGSSETATMVVWDSKTDTDTDVNEFRPLPFTKLKILDDSLQPVAEGKVGTIFIHTDALILNYFKNEAETRCTLVTIDGQRWFKTGDLGEQLPGGRVRFSGRAKRIIKRGANLIYPEEVESFLLMHPKIEAVAIVSESHELIGEMVIAIVQPQKGCTIVRGDLVRYCKGRLAAYKVPDQVETVEVMPTDIGKVQYKYLRKSSR